MKIEAGRYYRTRDGRKVGLISRGGHSEYPWRIPGLGTCNDDGLFLIGREHPVDLVAEWSEAPAAPRFRPGDEITLRVAAVLNDGRPIVETVSDLPCDGVIPIGNVLRHVAAPKSIDVGCLVDAIYDNARVRCRVEHIIDDVAWVHPINTSYIDAIRPLSVLTRIDGPAEASA